MNGMRIAEIEKLDDVLFIFVKDWNTRTDYHIRADKDGIISEIYSQTDHSYNIFVPYDQLEIQEFIKEELPNQDITKEKGYAYESFMRVKEMYELSIEIYEQIYLFLDSEVKSNRNVNREVLSLFYQDLYMKYTSNIIDETMFKVIYDNELARIQKELEENE